ncbi:MAG: class I SAM-dependent methyltransferase [Oscillospiraceae bacterium]|nr:class I SAM-dependent methyltransferase [Oscillospiraceae bacterium]
MNEQKFTGRADNYDRYRPSYPDSLIRWLYENTGAETVVDIGAGTGKFTACLQKMPWKLTAVEPNGDMLEKLKQNMPHIVAMQASAENTGLASDSFELVTVAQAFHWFDKSLFSEECRRILKDGGRLAIVWNERSKTGLSAARDAVCMKYCGSFHSGHVFTGYERSDSDGDSFLRNEYFTELCYFSEDYSEQMTRDAFIGDTLSRSYALCGGDEQYDSFICELERVFEKYQKDGLVTARYKTTCYLGKL